MNADDFSDRLWEFAARLGKLVDALPDTRLGRHVAGQLVRSGTSSAPNYDEARSAESPADFAHKLSIATKEMRETYGWLRFTASAELLTSARVSPLADESEQLLKMLTKSVQTTKSRNQESPVPNPKSPVKNHPLFEGLDHLAIAVTDTGEALKIWRDTMGFPLLYSEVVNGGTVRLTHLDMGNTQLQLVEPLTPDHPLQAWLAENGPGLHHFCMKVADVGEAQKNSPVPTAPNPHQGTQGKRALFFDKSATQGVQLEVTGN
jgi:methylmalonyl-CoA/ethylmalonyl-CoA epimerase